MSTNPPGGPPTQVPTVFLQGPPIERKELFHGRSSHVTELRLHVVGAVLGFVGLILAVWLFFASFGLLSIVGLLVSCIGGGLVSWAWLRVMSVDYRVDTLRVEVERGILRKRIDNLELWRVKDIQFRQSLSQRMLSVGDVVLVTSDATNPLVELRGIAAPRALYDSLRDAVDAAKRGRGMVGMETTST